MVASRTSSTASGFLSSSFSIVDDTSPALSPVAALQELPPEGNGSDDDFVLLQLPPSVSQSPVLETSSVRAFEDSNAAATPRVESSGLDENHRAISTSPATDLEDDLSRRLRLLDIAAREAESTALSAPLSVNEIPQAPPSPATTVNRVIATPLPPLEQRPMDWNRTPTPSDGSRSASPDSESENNRSHPPTPSVSPSPPPYRRRISGQAQLKSGGAVSASTGGQRKKKKKKKKVKGKKQVQAPKTEATAFGVSVDTYQEAVDSITWLLGHPSDIENVLSSPRGRLLYYQALLVEFGICPPDDDSDSPTYEYQLPSSQKAAKNLLNSTVHINVADYIEFRGRGFEVLKEKMLPTKSALRRAIFTRGRRRVPLVEIKRKGLKVLLADHLWH